MTKLEQLKTQFHNDLLDSYNSYKFKTFGKCIIDIEQHGNYYLTKAKLNFSKRNTCHIEPFKELVIEAVYDEKLNNIVAPLSLNGYTTNVTFSADKISYDVVALFDAYYLTTKKEVSIKQLNKVPTL